MKSTTAVIDARASAVPAELTWRNLQCTVRWLTLLIAIPWMHAWCHASPESETPAPFTSAFGGLRWENEEFSCSIPAFASGWNVQSEVSVPRQEDLRIAREVVSFSANGDHSRFELTIWDKPRKQSLKKWYKWFGRELCGHVGVTDKSVKTPAGERGIWASIEATEQAPAAELFFAASKDHVFCLRYLNQDDGANREAYAKLCTGFSTSLLGPRKGAATDPIGSPSDLSSTIGPKVGSCGGVVDACTCGGNNPYPCCSNGSNCTWGAWDRMCCNWGYAANNWGNAATWAANAQSAGNWVQSTPTVGSVACRRSHSDTPFGHVAYVLQISGGSVYVIQMNCDLGGAGWSYQWFTTSWFTGGYITRTNPNGPPPPPPGGSPVTHLAGWYRIVTQFSNKVFDVENSSMDNGADIRQWTWNGSAAQIFTFDHLGDGYYRITNKNSGKVLDVAGPSTADGAIIHQFTWNNTDNQKWRVMDLGGGNYRLVAKHSGKVADVANSGTADGTIIHQWTWSGSNAQKFKLENIPVPVANLSGEYRIIKKGADDKAIDVDNGGTENGVNVHLWQTNAGDPQMWGFERQSDGYYKITSRVSGKVLDVAGPSTADGANIHQWTWSGADNQRWSVEDLGDGYCRLVAKHSNKVVDTDNNGTGNGTNIQQWGWNGGNAQRWKIEKAGIPDAGLAGGFTINCKLGGNALDVANSSTANGGNIQVYTPNNSVAQKFTFEHQGNGYYKVIAQVSGKVLDVEAGSLDNSANIYQWTWNNTSNQRWRAELMDDGSYRFLANHSGKAMDAENTTVGGNVHQYTWHGGDNQRWLLTPATGPSAPAAPTGLAASGVSQTQVNLSWTDNAANEDNYVVARSTASGGPYTDIVTLAANVTTYSNTGLTANTTYYYVVRATNAAAASSSGQASAVTWPADIIVDNSSASFAVTGTWSTGTSATDKYGSDYRFHSTAASSTDTGVWTFSPPQARNYDIFAWWPAGTNRSTAATYTLPDNSTVSKNQQASGGTWNLLGTKSLTAGSKTVKLGCVAATGFIVVADAIKVVAK